MKNYNPELILKVNEIFHDIEGEEYTNKHPEIFEEEKSRWKRIFKKFLSNSKKRITLLDIGCGTGFVPKQIAKYLKQRDLFICSDISSTMLSVCKKDLSVKPQACSFRYVKLNGRTIPLRDNSVDYITVNSVLHHVPDIASFLKEISRILKPGGFLMIGHEPNKNFLKNRFLLNNFKLLSFLFGSKLELSVQFLERVGLWNSIKKLYYALSNKRHKPRLFEKVNDRLLSEKIIKKPLSPVEMGALIDFHSPLVGGSVDTGRGIAVEDIIPTFLPKFEMKHLETYNHIGGLSTKNQFTKGYDSILRKKYPKDGATFFAVFKKEFIKKL